MKVAYYSPLPPSRSGIADYSALLLPALRRLIDVEVMQPGRFRAPRSADVALYHVGNDPDAHGWIVDALRRRPGVVVLHDFVLHHLIAGITIGRRDGPAYLAALERDAGVPGRLLGHGVLEGRVPPLWEQRPEDFPLVGQVLDAALGLIVHSSYVEERARLAGYDGPVWRIPHPAWPVPDVEPARPPGSPVFGSFGNLNPSKRIPQLVEAFARVRCSQTDARLLLVGAESPGFQLEVEGAGILREDYADESRLWSLIAACDACVALRSPTMGETSGSAIRALSAGKPLIVSDLGWFAELPDEVALKVPVGEGEVGAVTVALELLGSSDAARQTMSAAALAYVGREHSLGQVAERYAAALEETGGGAAVRRAVLRDVAEAASQVGLEHTAELSARLRELELAQNGRPAPEPARAPGPLWRLPPLAWLAMIVLLSAAIRAVLSHKLVAPWIMVDELIYGELAKSFAATGHFLIRGAHHGSYGPLYPLLIAPAYRLFASVPEAYTAAKVINSVTMSLAAVPAYLLARRLLRPSWSLLAAVLAVAVPSLAYTGTLMTENLFYPLFLCVALALVRVLERPSAMRIAALAVFFVLAFETRAQAVVLLVAVASAPLLFAVVEGRPRRALRPYRGLYAALVGGVLVAVLAEVVRGHSPYDLLGQYGATAHFHYGVGATLKWLLYHLGELDLYLGVLPFAALLLLAGTVRRLDRPARAFICASVVLIAWLTLQVAAFAARVPIPPRVEERNLFYVAPLFLIGLLLWVDRGSLRPRRTAAVCALIAGALPGVLPFERLIDVPAESDTLGLSLPWWLVERGVIGLASVPAVVVLFGLVLAALFLLAPPRWALVMPAIVLAYFVLSTERVLYHQHGFVNASRGELFQGITTGRRDWIDHRVGARARVTFLWSGDNRLAAQLWENEFFNRSVRAVDDLGAPSPGGLPETSVHQAHDGTLTAAGRPVVAQYVLSDVSVPLAGTVIARDAPKGMVLRRVDGALRIAYRTSGIAPDRWSGRGASYTELRCTGGRLVVSLGSDLHLFRRGQTVRGASGGQSRSVRVPPGSARILVLPLLPRGGECRAEFSVAETAVPLLVEPGSNDPRQLGVRFLGFRYLPRR